MKVSRHRHKEYIRNIKDHSHDYGYVRVSHASIYTHQHEKIEDIMK